MFNWFFYVEHTGRDPLEPYNSVIQLSHIQAKWDKWDSIKKEFLIQPNNKQIKKTGKTYPQKIRNQ